MADETLLIDRWIYETLSQDATILADSVIHQGSTLHIYEGVAPASINVSRWIVFQMQSARDVLVVGGERMMVDCLYIVKVITTGSGSGSAVLSLVNRIDTLFNHTQDIETYVRIEESNREAPFRLNEPRGDITYRQRGGIYRIRAQVPL